MLKTNFVAVARRGKYQAHWAPAQLASAQCRPLTNGSGLADFNSDSFVDNTDFRIFVVAYNALLCP